MKPLYDFPSLLENMRTMLYDRTQGSRLLYTTWAGAYRSSPIESLRLRIVTQERFLLSFTFTELS